MSSAYKEQAEVLFRLADKLEFDRKENRSTREFHSNQIITLDDENTRLHNRIEALHSTVTTLRLLDKSGITLKDPEQKLSQTCPR